MVKNATAARTKGFKGLLFVTLLVMGLSTFAIGLLPTYASVGILAPALLALLRLTQGLALGGEWGGAALMVSESEGKAKGFLGSLVQVASPIGFLLANLAFAAVTAAVSEEAFMSWGWRLPFFASGALVAVGLYIRLSLDESPVFRKMKAEGRLSKSPLSETLTQWKHLRLVIAAMFGIIAGQATLWYASQFYSLFFLTQTLKVDASTANLLIAASLVIGTPFFIIFGSLSDRIGRKPIIMGGCLIAALTYFPIFGALTHYANPALETALAKSAVSVIADPADCSVQFDPIGTAKFTSSCDVAKNFLASSSVSYTNEAAAPGTPASVKIGETVIPSYVATGLDAAAAKAKKAEFTTALYKALKDHQYPVSEKQAPVKDASGAVVKNPDGTDKTATTYAMAPADQSAINKPMLVVMLIVLIVLVTLVYGPMAAALVELYPTRIRYTGMSLPYHIGNGWFGGLVPFVIFAMVAASGDLYYGLWYPIVVAALTFVIGLLFVPETKDRDLDNIPS